MPCNQHPWQCYHESCHVLMSYSKALVLIFSFKKKGKTDPREPMTFPYLTTEKIVSVVSQLVDVAATNNLSDANFEAPYKLMGLDALSVDRALEADFIVPCSFYYIRAQVYLFFDTPKDCAPQLVQFL